MLILCLATGRFWWLPARASLNINEGWNALHALDAWGAGPLYPAPDALTANNYPPLSFYFVGALGRALGDNVVAGRLLAVLMQGATTGAVAMLAVRLTERRAAAPATVLFGLWSVTLLRDYLAMNDPQWLGEALMSWALVLLVPRAGARSGAPAILAAALLTVASGLVKHNLLALPFAATLWLWLTDRRAFAIWAVTGVLLAGAAVALLHAVWGSTIFADVLAPARSYSVARMAAKGGPLLLAAVPALIACRPLVAACRTDRRLLLPILMLTVAVPIGVIQRAGSGVAANAFFETVIAIAVATGCAIALRPDRARAAALLTALPALCLVPVAARQGWTELTGRDARVRFWRPIIARIADAPGPVACDDQAVCYWAGRRSALDFFALKQRLLTGEGQALGPALAAHRFALIEMRGDNPGWQENRLIPAIRARYRTSYCANGIELLTPAEGSAPPRRTAAP